jgi:hypothetical protein
VWTLTGHLTVHWTVRLIQEHVGNKKWSIKTNALNSAKAPTFFVKYVQLKKISIITVLYVQDYRLKI